MRALLVVVVCAVACGSHADVANAPSATLAATATASANANASSPSPTTTSPAPARVSGTLVRVSVNGVERTANSAIPGPLTGPATVRLTFPFDVGRASFERFLPNTVTPKWVDDHTVDLVVAQGTQAFKAVEIPSADGRSVIDMVFVTVLFPASRVVNVYRITDLVSATPRVLGAPATPQPASSYRVHLPAQRGPVPSGVALSADATTMLVYDTKQSSTGSGVQLIDVATDAARMLASPGVADGPFAFADWLSDGRLLIAGRRVWTANADGSAMRVLADNGADGLPDAVVPAPNARVAAMSFGTRVVTIDLMTGTRTPLPDAFHACPGANLATMTWSLDATRLASIDCPTPGDPDMSQVQILDVPTRKVIATIGGGAYRVSTFPSAELLVVGPSTFMGEGAPSLGRVLSFDGVERRRYLGGSWQLSADQRYLLQMEPVGGAGSDLGTFFTLIDQKTAAKYTLFLPWGSRWLPDGRLAGF